MNLLKVQMQTNGKITFGVDYQHNQTSVNTKDHRFQPKHVEATALLKQGRWSIKFLTTRFDINEFE